MQTKSSIIYFILTDNETQKMQKLFLLKGLYDSRKVVGNTFLIQFLLQV